MTLEEQARDLLMKFRMHNLAPAASAVILLFDGKDYYVSYSGHCLLNLGLLERAKHIINKDIENED